MDITLPDGRRLAYPRKRIARRLLRGLGRLTLPLLFRLEIRGRENFPPGGPLLVVGNHVAAMEAVLMAVFTPWQVEMLGSVDIPHERITEIAMGLWGAIPLHRGRTGRRSLRQALDVLAQDGILGIFPEGGIWEPNKRPQTGVAWLSYRTGTPVLPIGFGGTAGAIGAALRLERPRLTMTVGAPLAPAKLTPEKSNKDCLEAYAVEVVAAVKALLPADDPGRRTQAVDERFALEVEARTADGRPVPLPETLAIDHGPALARFLHRPPVLKIFDRNLHLPISPLQDLAQHHDPAQIAAALRPILAYLAEENPHFLQYRFGPRLAEAMEAGLRELLALADWCARAGLVLAVTPIRRYYSPEQGVEVVQTEQGRFEDWM